MPAPGRLCPGILRRITLCECGETEGEALGHTLVADSAIDPTCTETGVTIEVDSLESVVLNNTASTIARIATVKVLYVG